MQIYIINSFRQNAGEISLLQCPSSMLLSVKIANILLHPSDQIPVSAFKFLVNNVKKSKQLLKVLLVDFQGGLLHIFFDPLCYTIFIILQYIREIDFTILHICVAGTSSMLAYLMPQLLLKLLIRDISTRCSCIRSFPTSLDTLYLNLYMTLIVILI